ncbi:MAG: V-type ATP synthase subunit D [Spirochaetes bacterium]|nr:MAG: V-type ATP synthase subunit D [Spirochaetota bacterium]
MAKIKLTKNELKRQKDMLSRFERYLPTLVLKKQQLQLVIRRVEAEIRKKMLQKEEILRNLMDWVHVFGEEVGIDKLVKIRNVETEVGNIAGVDIPVFKGIEFEDITYDLFIMPLWVDRGLEELKRIIALDAEIDILNQQKERLGEELRITTQRVNLFEKVKIPETRENIRIINIYLGDQQTAEVIRGKIAKKKLTRQV